jgi:hypothetical protein
MSASAPDQGAIGRFCDWVKARFQQGDDLYALSRADLSLMASDLGIAENDLREILPKSADNTLLLDKMMIQRGLDPEKVRAMWGGLARDLEITCCRCGAAARCRGELQLGLAAENAHEYCGNAETFDDLLAGA